MISRGKRLGIAIGITAVLLGLNAAVILNGLGENASTLLLAFYGDQEARIEMLRPPTARYAADSVHLIPIRMKL